MTEQGLVEFCRHGSGNSYLNNDKILDMNKLKRAKLDCNDLIGLFNRLFLNSHQTKLAGGGQEPVYLPADCERGINAIIFSHDYFASALHEVAHWCIAGRSRRAKLDYGYWYVPEGRNTQQQAKFEQVETRPQALEWIFAKACQADFRVSFDNPGQLNAEAERRFVLAVKEQVAVYKRTGLPRRAQLYLDALENFYGSKIAAKQRLAIN